MWGRPCRSNVGPFDVWLGGYPRDELCFYFGAYCREIRWKMVKFAVLECACLVFVCTSAAQYCEAVWFGWVGEDWPWVQKSGGAIGCQLFEDFLSLGLWCVTDKIAGIALLIGGTGTRNAAVVRTWFVGVATVLPTSVVG